MKDMDTDGVDTDGVVRLVQAMANAVAAQVDYLGQLDAIAGDGDHGVGLSRALTAAVASLAETPLSSPGEALRTTGRTLTDVMGGAAGLLFGTIFTTAAKRAADRDQLTTADWAAMLADALDAVRSRGKASPGDRTMVDALAAAVPAMQAAAADGLSLPRAFDITATAAEKGAEATATMVARYGRARYVGERSLGQPDAGASSLALMLRAGARQLAQTPHRVPGNATPG